MDIKIEKLSESEIHARNIRTWPVWEKEVSRFDWSYEDTEECLILEGDIVVETDNGESVQIGVGDFVTFPRGLSCTWDIQSPVRKYYNFI